LLESEEQQRPTREIEAEQQLRAEEVRLSDLRDQLERLDKALGTLASERLAVFGE
jgi:chorismate mutase